MSRRSSLAESVASSQYTTESRQYSIPQHTLDGTPLENRNSRTSSDFGLGTLVPPQHHHHSLQNKQIGDLQNKDAGSPTNSGPYSRTPELRVSHKLAERKRRNEMKDLYERAKDVLGMEKGSKASKWETLNKAIVALEGQQKEIHKLRSEVLEMKSERDYQRAENQQLKHENHNMRHVQSHVSLNGTGHGHPNPPLTPSDAYTTDPYGRSNPGDPYTNRPEPGRRTNQLPPLQTVGQHPPIDQMSGVKYQYQDGPRTGGFGGNQF